MEFTDASERLRALASSPSFRSLSARLKDLMPDIDYAMQNGVSRSEIIQILSDSGLEVTRNYFSIVRSRIKKSSSLAKVSTTLLGQSVDKEISASDP